MKSQFTSRYSINNTVYYINGKSIYSGKITSISMNADSDGISFEYEIDDDYNKESDELFSSKQSAMKELVKQICDSNGYSLEGLKLGKK